MNGNVLTTTQTQIPSATMTRQVGSNRRNHVHHANVFHACVMTGCACLNISLASTSGLGVGVNIAGVFSTLGGAAVRMAAGMLRFAPQ